MGLRRLAAVRGRCGRGALALCAQTYPRSMVVNIGQSDLDECVRRQTRAAVDVTEVVRRHEETVERAKRERNLSAM